MECQSRHWPDARDRQEASQGWIIADETADFLVKHRHLGSGNPALNDWLETRCRELWALTPHGSQAGTVADAWAEEAQHLMPLSRTFDGFVEYV
jgi:hypothetical protein